MSTTRTVTVTAELTQTLRDEYEIDEADYLDWLGEDADTNAAMREYLCSGIDTYEIVSSIYDGAMRNGRHEVASAEIVEVTR